MNKAFVGFDPGKDGGMAIVDENGNLTFTATFPKIGNEIDLIKFRDLIYGIKNYSKHHHVILERVHSIFGSSAKSNHVFGKVNGYLEMAVVCADLKHTFLEPKSWQKIAWEGVKPIEISTGKFSKKGLPKMKIDTKATSLIVARKLFPTWNFIPTARSKNAHSGLVDAALIAYVGYCKFK